MRTLSICAVVASLVFMFAIILGAFPGGGDRSQQPYPVVEGRER